MTSFDSSSDLRGARFTGVDLSGARIRGSDVSGLEVDSPWLIEERGTLLVNGVDVVPYVDAELDRRFPGRELRRAATPEELRAAWAALQGAWEAQIERAASLPDETRHASVDGEWSFVQTLRHLVMATDTWLGKAVLLREQPYHPHGLSFDGAADEGFDVSQFADDVTWDEALAARADRTAMVTDFLATVTPEVLAEERRNPWAPDHAETVLSCLHTILEEGWEHLRYAVRDLDLLGGAAAAGRTPGTTPPP